MKFEYVKTMRDGEQKIAQEKMYRIITIPTTTQGKHRTPKTMDMLGSEIVQFLREAGTSIFSIGDVLKVDASRTLVPKTQHAVAGEKSEVKPFKLRAHQLDENNPLGMRRDEKHANWERMEW